MVVGRTQDTVLCGRADPSREGANILEFETFSETIFFGWWLRGLRIPFAC